MASHEVSPPFRQALLAIVGGTARSDAPRMRRRPGTLRTRELSYRRRWSAGFRIAACRVHLSGSAPSAPLARGGTVIAALWQPRSCRRSQILPCRIFLEALYEALFTSSH